MNQLRVLVVDDHMIIRKGLMQVLTEIDEAYSIDEAENAPGAMNKLRGDLFDVVLLDVALGERDGFDVLKSIRSEFPSMGVVMLSVYPETQFAVRAIKAGAHSYLNKCCSPFELDQALKSAQRGQVFVNPGTATLLALDVRSVDGKPPHDKLSNREMQVMLGLASGRSVAQLADQFSLSANTISTYRARVFEKLGLKNLVDLINYVSENGLDRMH